MRQSANFPTIFPKNKLKTPGDQSHRNDYHAAKEKLPQVIQEFNIGEVVREKINNYPVEKLESLVMSVAKEHLRTIELFGALFGFVIGVVQAIMSYFIFVK